MNDPIDIANLVPHSGPMLLVDRLVEAGDGFVVCEAVVRSDGLFDANGQVPAMVGLEYMAQTVAAYSGLQRGDSAIKIGFLLGTRRFKTNVSCFSCGESLKIKVSPLLHGEDGLGAFDCIVTGDDILQTARLVVFEPPEAGPHVDAAIHTPTRDDNDK